MTTPRFVRFLAVATALAAFPATSYAQFIAPPCAPSSQVLGTVDGSTFTLFYGITNGTTWTAARDAACTPGGRLAVLNNSTRMTTVSGWLNTFWTSTTPNVAGIVNTVGPWVGAYSAAPSNTVPRPQFFWLDGSAFDPASTPGFGWSSNQPDYRGGYAQGVTYGHETPVFQKFGDYGQVCGTNSPPTDCAAGLVTAFVWETSVVPEPSTYALLASGLLAIGVVARRRRKS